MMFATLRRHCLHDAAADIYVILRFQRAFAAAAAHFQP